MTHRDFVGAMRAPLDYLGQRSLPDRLTALGLPVLVVFGADDGRWRSSSAAGRLRIVDFLAGRYIEPLHAAGCRDVSVRRLGWRMRSGSPVNVTGLVSARKPGS